MFEFQKYIQSPTCWTVFLGALLTTACLTPLTIWLARKIGAVEGGGYRRIHQGAMPLMGGLAIAAPFILVTILCTTEWTGMFQVVHDRARDLLILAGGSVAIVLLGIVDDVFGLRARYKLLAQIAIALFVAESGNAIHFVTLPLLGVVNMQYVAGIATFLTVLWIVGITNAFNIIDGIDGLAAGVAFMASLSLAIIAAVNGATFVVLLCAALSGSLLAFLWYNWHPARVFLGDTGSLFLGFALATVSLMGSHKSSGGALILGSVLALGIPIFETFISMIRRYVGGFPIFAPDSRHTHHRLLKRGFTQRQAAVVLYAGAFFCLLAAVWSSTLSSDSPFATFPILFVLIVLLGIAGIAGYTDTLASKFSRRQTTLRRLACARYAELALVPGCSAQSVRQIMSLLCYELRLSLIEIRYMAADRPLNLQFTAEGSNIVALAEQQESFRVKTSDGDPAEVAYCHDHKAGEMERHTVAACLASVFDGFNVHAFGDPLLEAHVKTEAKSGAGERDL